MNEHRAVARPPSRPGVPGDRLSDSLGPAREDVRKSRPARARTHALELRSHRLEKPLRQAVALAHRARANPGVTSIIWSGVRLLRAAPDRSSR